LIDGSKAANPVGVGSSRTRHGLADGRPTERLNSS
jgi:hypothetical protein